MIGHAPCILLVQNTLQDVLQQVPPNKILLSANSKDGSVLQKGI
jgi:hypothetical protein